jgi:hypothetical protein
MKYIIAFVALFMTSLEIISSNLCWCFQNVSDPRLVRRVISHATACTCECWQQPHTKGTNNEYKCLKCGHRLTPPDPLSKNGPQFKRYYEKKDGDRQIDTMMESPQTDSSPSQVWQLPQNQQWRESSYTAPFQHNNFPNN